MFFTFEENLTIWALYAEPGLFLYLLARYAGAGRILKEGYGIDPIPGITPCLDSKGFTNSFSIISVTSCLPGQFGLTASTGSESVPEQSVL